jgi:hypothetical protein
MIRTGWLASAICLTVLVLPAQSAPAKYTIKTGTAEPPAELKDGFRKLLGNQSVQLLDAKGQPVAEVWLRKEVAAKAKAEAPKEGAASYRVLQDTTFVGAIRIPKAFTDYRQQNIKPGVYTLRFGLQPMNGNHMGTAPYNEFALLIPADQDASPDPLESMKELNKKSNKAAGTDHPAILLLFPNNKPGDAPELADKGKGHWVLNSRTEVTIDGKKLPLGIGLTLVGHADE